MTLDDLPLFRAARERAAREEAERRARAVGLVIPFPRFHRGRLVVNHVRIEGRQLVRYDCYTTDAEGEALVLASISEVHLRRVLKKYSAMGYAIEHRGHRRTEAPPDTSGDGRARA